MRLKRTHYEEQKTKDGILKDELEQFNLEH